jgi:SAM-dependent methyltransferase
VPTRDGGPDDHELRNRDHWDQRSDWYQAGHGAWIAATPDAWGAWRVPEAALRLLPDIAGQDILELGCGAGQWAIWLAWQVYRWLMEPANNVEYTIPFGQPVTALKAAQEALQKRWTQVTGVDGRAYALTASVSLPSGGGMLKYGTWPKVLDQLTPLFADMRAGHMAVNDYAERAAAIIDRDLAPRP